MVIACRVPLRIDLAGGWSDIPPFARREGGAVLTLSITRYATGEVHRMSENGSESLRFTYGLDLPSGAGLGSSASLSVLWLALVHANMGHDLEREELARSACDLGYLLGILGGKQDEYAAALGGINLMRFHDAVHVEPITLLREQRERLEQRLVLCYSGHPRLSVDIHDRVWGAYERGDQGVARCLAELRDLAIVMTSALRAEDYSQMADLMNANWQAQQGLHPSITNDEVDHLYRVARAAGAQAGKACGAGGGGCLAFMADPDAVPHVRAALHNAGATLIDVGIDWDGVTVWRN